MDCACKDADAYSCWAKRYNLSGWSGGYSCTEVEADGGPCECVCHDVECDWGDAESAPLRGGAIT